MAVRAVHWPVVGCGFDCIASLFALVLFYWAVRVVAGLAERYPWRRPGPEDERPGFPVILPGDRDESGDHR